MGGSQVGANTVDLAARIRVVMELTAEVFMAMVAVLEEILQDFRTPVLGEIDSKNTTNLMKAP